MNEIEAINQLANSTTNWALAAGCVVFSLTTAYLFRLFVAAKDELSKKVLPLLESIDKKLEGKP